MLYLFPYSTILVLSLPSFRDHRCMANSSLVFLNLMLWWIVIHQGVFLILSHELTIWILAFLSIFAVAYMFVPHSLEMCLLLFSLSLKFIFWAILSMTRVIQHCKTILELIDLLRILLFDLINIIFHIFWSYK